MRLCRGLLLVTSLFVVSAAVAQKASAPQHAIEDWSSSHVVFTGLTAENVSEVAKADPRAWSVWQKHAHRDSDSSSDRRPIAARRRVELHRHRRGSGEEKKYDWQMPIPKAVRAWASPAKYTFDINAVPDCTNDYVLFPTGALNAPGSPIPGASLIAFNNLYTGPGPTGICPSPLAPASGPSVLFAYNIATTTFGGTSLSPVLSLDGKKVAFLEGNGFGPPFLIFHVLTWKAGEGTSSTSPALPGDCSPGNSCMTSIDISDIGVNTHSNLFVDYAHDTAYVGDDAGVLHKITPVFNGVPQEATGSGWPVQLASSLMSPVYDSVSGRIFVTNFNGCSLYVVDANSGTLLATKNYSCFSQSDTIVDSTNQTVFVVAAQNPSFQLTALQFDTLGNLLRQTATGVLGGTITVFTGTFDHQYFSSPSLGHFYFGGPVNGIASIYSVGFTGNIMNSSFSGPLPLTTMPFSSVPERLTEFYNPSLPSSPDRLFVPIDANCGPSVSGQGDGCIVSVDISNGLPSSILNSFLVPTRAASLSLSGIIVDNVSSSTQASSIYFEASPPDAAFKLTQAALQ